MQQDFKTKKNIIPKNFKNKNKIDPKFLNSRKRRGNFKNNRFRGKRIIKNKKRVFPYFKSGLMGRPYSFYRGFVSRKYLYFTLLVRPNNVFAGFMGVSRKRGSSFDKTKYLFNIRKKASDFGIQFSRKGMKTKVLTFLNRFIYNIFLKKTHKYSFMVVNITAPQMLRKKILNTIYTSYIRKRFRKKRIIINIKHQKVFNGCCPRKKIKKKRRKFRLFK